MPAKNQADEGEEPIGLEGDLPAAMNILAVPIVDPHKKNKKHTPQEGIDEFWKKFSTKKPGKAFTVLPNNLYAKRAAANAPKGVIPGHNALASFEEAAATCKDKVEKIVRECRRVNQKFRDVHFDIEFDLKWGVGDCLCGLMDEHETFSPASAKRVEDIFEKPQFFVDGATAGDVRQGRDGDCWFMAALCTLSNKAGMIRKICVARDEAVGVYGFVFHRDGEWISTIIDDQLYLTKPDYDEGWRERLDWDDRERVDGEEDYRKTFQMGSGALYFAQCSDPNETWLPLLEKAYAKACGDFSAIEGGFVGEGIEDLTGGVTTELFTTDILDKGKFWKDELLKVNEQFLFGCATGLFGGWGERKGIQEGHAYSIMKAVEIGGERLLLLRNPWGKVEWNGPWSDGSKEWTPEWMERLDHRFGNDGAFWISYRDLLQKYQHFDRTRLFGPEWTVTQQWTSLEVPWTVDYHDTKFEITQSKKSQVVIVLSQLDDRYFRGLQGQYRFELQFRVHREGEVDYIVRSHGNYCMRRSVSCELELDAGKYSVLLKIIATRIDFVPPILDVITKTCLKKPDKLLQIGLSYDLAHAKGQIKETDKEKKIREEREAKKKAAEEKKLMDERRIAHQKNAAFLKRVKEKARAKKISKAQKAKKKAEAAAAKAKALGESESEASVPKKGDSESPESGDENKDAEAPNSDVNKKSEEKPGESAGKESVANNDKETAPEEVKKSEENSPETTDKKQKDESVEVPAPKKEEPAPKKEDPETTTDKPAAQEEKLPNGVVSIDTNKPIHVIIDEADISDISSVSSFDEDENYQDMLHKDDVKDEIPTLPDIEEEDEFEKNPWNAVCVVGLRVYSQDSKITVAVVRPNEDDAETGLDVDDAAVDATKDSKDADVSDKKAEANAGKE
ncbi:MAG: hypothetical protein M1829_002849 [Trizodia sp. TS-e1964]|nr:MAG: hypothetical protein M1829_002849 [Trizodia sp. TS-e1964]